MIKLIKPTLKNSLSVEEIHKIREYHYSITKDFSSEELIEYINNEANKVRKIINKNKKGKIAI